jgi:hypothetical protein
MQQFEMQWQNGLAGQYKGMMQKKIRPVLHAIVFSWEPV